jgi:hypothetical protein
VLVLLRVSRGEGYLDGGVFDSMAGLHIGNQLLDGGTPFSHYPVLLAGEFCIGLPSRTLPAPEGTHRESSSSAHRAERDRDIRRR